MWIVSRGRKKKPTAPKPQVKVEEAKPVLATLVEEKPLVNDTPVYKVVQPNPYVNREEDLLKGFEVPEEETQTEEILEEE